jgi:hypothetical protein
MPRRPLDLASLMHHPERTGWRLTLASRLELFLLPVAGCQIDDLVLQPVCAKAKLKGWLEKRSGERLQFLTDAEIVAHRHIYIIPAVLGRFLI